MTEMVERPGWPTFETGPGSTINALSRKLSKHQRASATTHSKPRVMFLQEKTVKEMCTHRSHKISHKSMKVQSQCARVTLFGDSVRINHMFGSSGLNLASEGLLLGMRNRARKGVLPTT
jgi:hypothetical protein